MILKSPFAISARLLPALRIGDAWLSWDGGVFFLDRPDSEYVIDDFHPGAIADVQECFAAILSFMSAAAESRQYRERTGMQGKTKTCSRLRSSIGLWKTTTTSGAWSVIFKKWKD